MFDMDTLRNLAGEGFLHGNRYVVHITNPISATPWTAKLASSCQALDVPGTFYATYERRQKGPLHKLPNDRVFVEANLTFLQDSKAEARKYFQSWHDGMYVKDNFRFFEEYKGQCSIDIYNRENEKALTVKLIDCYPIFINAVGMSYDSKEIEHMTVGLQGYRITVE